MRVQVVGALGPAEHLLHVVGWDAKPPAEGMGMGRRPVGHFCRASGGCSRDEALKIFWRAHRRAASAAYWWLLIAIMLVGQGRLFQCTNSGACARKGGVWWGHNGLRASA